ncbi:MAG: hypothetical protein LBD03_03395 [Methanobrevibacter sp.]|nr:hypothetical protein [Candidatus Methanovirga procula]
MYWSISKVDSLRKRMIKNLINKDAEGLNSNLSEMIANVPYHLHIDKEAYYHTIFLTWLNLLDFKVNGEASTDK